MSELEVLEIQYLNEDSNEHQEDNQKSSRIYKLEENELRNMRKHRWMLNSEMCTRFL